MSHIVNQDLILKGGLNKFTTAGSATVYTGTLTEYGTTLVDQSAFTIKFHLASGAAPTLNLNAIGAKTLKDSKGNNLNVGDLTANVPYLVHYDLAADFFYVVDATGPNTRKYTQAFTGVTTFTVLGTTHGISFPFVVEIDDVNGTTDTTLGASATVDNTNGDITYTQNVTGDLRLTIVG